MADEQAQAVEAKAEEAKKQEVKKEEAKPEAAQAGAPKQAEPKKEVKVSEKLQGVLKTIEELTVLELAELVKALEDKFGVSAAAAAVAVAAPGGAGAAAGGAAEEEQTAFDVILASVGDKKIQVIKEIRGVTSLGLKEAKDLVEGAPKPIKTGVTKEEAAKIKETLEKQGAKIEIK